MQHYYETSTEHEIQAHDTLEEAIQFAEANNCEIISEIGGNWAEWEKCSFCGDWFDSCELNTNRECATCEMMIRAHGGH